MSLQRNFQQAVQGKDAELIVPPPSNPMAVARMFLATNRTDQDGNLLIRHHCNTFHGYTGTCWPEIEDRALISEMYRWLESAKFWKQARDGEELKPFEPTRYKLGDLMHAAAALTHVHASETPPLWLTKEPPWPASEMVAMANGILHIRTRQLVPHSPTFFSPHALSFAFDPSAPPPDRWMRFLSELWEDDEESAETLAELMGISSPVVHRCRRS
jgi:putative DNA primase/helicase